MTYSLLRILVEDFDRFKAVFDSNAAVRADKGCRGARIFRTRGAENEVHVLLEWDTPSGPWELYLRDSDTIAGKMREGTVIEGSLHLYFLDLVAESPS